MKQSSNATIKVLFIGDIVGKPGRFAVKEYLDKHKGSYDLVFANAENLSSGKGITIEKYQEMLNVGIDYFTSGNHVWSYSEFVSYLDDGRTKVLRPANYPSTCPGRGSAVIARDDYQVVIINLQGRVFMPSGLEDPFIIGKNICDANKDRIIILDFHAEATSEKIALGYYLDGLASAVLGTHTHVQTADEKVLPSGTGYISDIGMCGPVDSVLGVKKEIIIEKFLTQLPQSHKVAVGDAIFSAVELTIDKKTKKTTEIKRISEIFHH